MKSKKVVGNNSAHRNHGRRMKSSTLLTLFGAAWLCAVERTRNTIKRVICIM